MSTARANGYVFRILESVEEVNENQKRLMVEKIVARFGEDLSGLHFGLWGLSFKPNTDDMREAAAIAVVRGLRERGASIKAYDPEAKETAQAILGDSIEYCDDPYETIEGADALILATEWTEFRRPDFDRIGALMKNKLIFDGRNIYSANTMRKYGFERHGVGIPVVEA